MITLHLKSLPVLMLKYILGKLIQLLLTPCPPRYSTHHPQQHAMERYLNSNDLLANLSNRTSFTQAQHGLVCKPHGYCGYLTESDSKTSAELTEHTLINTES